MVVAVVLGFALINSQGEVQTQTAAAVEAREERDFVLDLVGALPPELSGLISVAEAGVPMVRTLVSGDGGMSLLDGASSAGGVDANLAGRPAGIAQRATGAFFRATLPPIPVDADAAPDAYSARLREAAALSTSDPQAALTVVEQCIEERGDDFAAWQLRLALNAELGQVPELAVAAQRLVELEPTGPSAAIWTGLAHLLLDHGEAGLERLTVAVEQGTEPVWPLVFRGLALVRVGKASLAVADFDRALALAPNLVPAILGRAAAHAFGRNFVAAIADISRVIELEPDNAHARAMRGEYHIEGGDPTAALSDLEAAMSLGGRTPAMALRYLLVLSRQRQAVQVDPDDTARPPDTEAEGEVDPETGPPDVGIEEGEESSSLTVGGWLARLLGLDPHERELAARSPVPAFSGNRARWRWAWP